MSSLLLRRRMMMQSGGGDVPPNSQMWYQTIDNSIRNFYLSFDANILSENFDGKKWIVKFDKDITTISSNRESKNITSVWLPDSCVILGTDCFSAATYLTFLRVGENIDDVKNEAFQNALNIDEYEFTNIKKASASGFLRLKTKRLIIQHIEVFETNVFANAVTNNVELFLPQNDKIAIIQATNSLYKANPIHLSLSLKNEYLADGIWSQIKSKLVFDL